MTSTQSPAELEERLFKEVRKDGLGMLGLAGGQPHHMQPMTAFCDEGGGSLWFYTRNDTDLVKQAGQGHPAMFSLMTKDREFIACAGGTLTEDKDRTHIERFWNPIAGAWFPEGKDDPALTMLRFDPEDAEVWISHTNPVRFAFDIAKANLTQTLPDVGGKQHIDL